MPRGHRKGKHGPSRPGGVGPRGERRGAAAGPRRGPPQEERRGPRPEERRGPARGAKRPHHSPDRPGAAEFPARRPFEKAPRSGAFEDERRPKRGPGTRPAGRPVDRPPVRGAGRPTREDGRSRQDRPGRGFAARDERPARRAPGARDDRGARRPPDRRSERAERALPPRPGPREAIRPRAETAADTAAREGMAFGFHAVRTALTHSPRRVERLLLSRGAEDGRVRHLVALAREAGVPFQEVPKEALDRLSDSVRHQGVAARLAGADLLPAEELLDALPDDALVVVLDGIEDPRNIGAILRSAAAFGAAGVFLPIHHSAGLSPAAIKTAAGAIDLVPVARAGNVSRLLEELADRGLTAVALDPESGVPPWEAPLAGPIALVAGGEESGIRPTVAARCPVRVRIPIRDEVGSLNVSVAVGIVLAEARRQRDKPLPILDDGEGGW